MKRLIILGEKIPKFENKVIMEKSIIYSPLTQFHFKLMESKTLIPTVEFKKQSQLLKDGVFKICRIQSYAYPLSIVPFGHCTRRPLQFGRGYP
jgi:hypothetical protein